MFTDNIDTELIDFFEHLAWVMSPDFVEKWKFKYSKKFIKHFQLKILNNLDKNKPLKITTLFNYLVKRCKYSETQVSNFFESIDLHLLFPLIINK